MKNRLAQPIVNLLKNKPFMKPSEVHAMLGVDVAVHNVNQAMTRLHARGILGRIRSRYFIANKEASKNVYKRKPYNTKSKAKPTKQLEIDFNKMPEVAPAPQPVAQPVPNSPYTKIQALEKELYELKVQLLDQYAIIKYLEKKLESNE